MDLPLWLEWTITLLLLVAGLSALVYGGDLFVHGAILFSRRTGWSQRLTGLTIVAIGTSLPELASSVSASLQRYGEVVVGNVLGSNVCNTFLIPGIALLIMRLRVESAVRRIEIPMFIGLSVLLLLVVSDPGREQHVPGIPLYWNTGLMLLLILAAFLYVLYQTAGGKAYIPDQVEELAPWSRILLRTTVGLTLLSGGSWLAVRQIARLAELTGIASYALSAVILAVATSLPEISVTIASVRRKASSMMLGNVFGSNFFNLSGVLGVSLLIHPIVFQTVYLVDLLLAIGGALLILANPYFRGYVLPRAYALLFLAIYAGYLVWLFFRYT